MFDKNYLNHNFIIGDKSGFNEYFDGRYYICNKCNIGVVYWNKWNDYYIEKISSEKLYKDDLTHKLDLTCNEVIVKSILE